MKTCAIVLLLSSTAVAAARKHHRQDSQRQSYIKATQLPAGRTSNSQQPLYSFSPASPLTASPSPAPSQPGPTSTQASSNLLLAYPSPVSSATGSYTTSPIFSYAPNGTDCGGATLNVINASLDYWWDMTIYDPIYTLSYQHDPVDHQETGWTILGPATTNQPLPPSTVQCATTGIWITATWDQNETFWGTSCSEVEQIVAPATTAVTVTQYVSPTQFSGTGYDIPTLVTYPPDPTVTVPGSNYTYDPQSNVVYFSQYEIMSSNLTTYANGQAVCNTATRTYNLPVPYAFTYTGISPEYADDPFATITDNLDPALSTALGLNATLGSFTAVPTVIYIVAEAFSLSPLIRIQHSLLSNTKLDVPSPTLPPDVDATTTSGYGYSIYTSALNTDGGVQSSGQFLLLPTPTTTASVGGFIKQSDVAAPSSSDALAVLTQALGSAILHGLGATTAAPVQTLNIAGATASASTAPAVIVGTQTVAPGQAVVVSGTIVSVATAGASIVINGNTVALPPSGDVITAGGIPILPTDLTVWSVAGQTLMPGGAAVVVSGTSVSLFAGGGALLVGSSTSMLQTRVITIGPQTVTADANNDFVVAGQTLTTNGVIVVAGTTYSLASGATALIANGQTTPILAVAAQTIVARPALTVDGQIITPTSGGSWIVSGQTLTTGGAVTFNGISGKETISIDNAGSVLVQIISGSSSTATLGSSTVPVLVIGGQTFTAQAPGGSTYVVNGQTITAGSARTVVVRGTTYVVSLAASPTAAEIDQLGSSGQAVSTTIESLWTPASTVGTTIGSSISSPTSSVTGSATTFAIELMYAAMAGSALAIAVWL